MVANFGLLELYVHYFSHMESLVFRVYALKEEKSKVRLDERQNACKRKGKRCCIHTV